jgi:cytochrome c-type biogenesis protein CcmF
MEKRDALKVWTILLAILTFSLSLMGTFLVRSGVLTSVHAFAVDPQRGIFILGIMAVFTGGGLALFAMRASELRQGGLFAPISREGSLVLNNILLTTACATVLVGTLYPLLLESLTGDKISVGAPYFDLTFGPLMVPLLLALPFGPFLAWKRGDLRGAAQRLMFAAMLAVVVFAVSLAAFYRGPVLAPFGLALGMFVMAGAVSDLCSRARFGDLAWRDAWRRLLGLPRSAFGTALAHFGVGVMVVGIVATTAYRQEQILVMKPSETVSMAGYDLAFRGVAPATGPNYREEVGVFDVTRGGSPVVKLEPSKRLYDQPPQPTTEAGIHASWRGDLYVVLGDPQNAGGYAVRVYFNPLVRFIWIGAVIMFLAGAVSLSDRRLRVGAPGRARKVAAPAPAE